MKELLIRFNLETAIIALLHDDHDTFNQQLTLFSKKSGRGNVSRMIKGVGIQRPELEDNEMFSLILIAAYKCNQDAFEKLLSLGGNVNQQNNWGRTPLMLAGLSENYAMLEYLMSKKANPLIKDFRDNTFKWYFPYKTHHFVRVITEGNKTLIELLMPEQKVAKAHGNRSVVVKSINEKFQNPQDEKVTPLMAIAAKTEFEANPEADEDHKYDKDRQYYANLAGKLIGMGVKVDKQNNYGKTALMYATIAGNGLMMQALRESGANANLRDSRRKTIRHHSKGKEKLINETAATHTPETGRKYDIMPL
jgi:hypothetical protein